MPVGLTQIFDQGNALAYRARRCWGRTCSVLALRVFPFDINSLDTILSKSNVDPGPGDIYICLLPVQSLDHPPTTTLTSYFVYFATSATLPGMWREWIWSVHLFASGEKPLSNKFQIDVYFFEVYTHCEAPKLISNKIEIHPFWDFPKLKLTHREEFPSLGGHHLVLISIWWELHFGNSSSW